MSKNHHIAVGEDPTLPDGHVVVRNKRGEVLMCGTLQAALASSLLKIADTIDMASDQFSLWTEYVEDNDIKSVDAPHSDVVH